MNNFVKKYNDLLNNDIFSRVEDIKIEDMLNKELVLPEEDSDTEIMDRVALFFQYSYDLYEKKSVKFFLFNDIKKVFSYHRENILKAFVNKKREENNIPCIGITIPINMNGYIADAYIVFSASKIADFYSNVFFIQRNTLKNNIRGLFDKRIILKNIIINHAFMNIERKTFIFNFNHNLKTFGIPRKNFLLEDVDVLRFSEEASYVQYSCNEKNKNNYIETKEKYKKNIKKSCKWIISGIEKSKFSGELIISKDNVDINPINIDNAFIYKK